ncbi:UNVERIFIED_CONTAM: hypothetical protein PYX00_003211 [Menopon gallinae]
MALRLAPPGRTQGDGMEKPENDGAVEHTIVLQPRTRKSSGVSETTVFEKSNSSPRPPAMQSAIKLVPQAVNKKKKDILTNLKNKEPKFVPYEPYKAAVKPIVPDEKKHFRVMSKKKSKETAAILKGREEKGEVAGNESGEVPSESDGNVDWEKKSKSLELELQTLKEENEQLENQLKFQVQVNGELKNLLVAAVGEDMETRVHVLTEDKLHLAQALLKSAKSLSSHQEQTEWLAGQCEVWRSKFLASSVMVEELARWKAALTHKVNEAQEVLKKLLEERKSVRENLTNTYNNLSFLRDNFNLLNKKNPLSSGNVIDLSEENFRLSETLLIQLLGVDKGNSSNSVLKDLPNDTPAEKAAEHTISNPHLLHLIGEPDAACSAVVGAAVALSGQLYLQSNPPRIECCPQCSGEIKLV